MSKVILVRMEVKHEYADQAEMIVEATRHWALTFMEELDRVEVEVVTEDAA